MRMLAFLAVTSTLFLSACGPDDVDITAAIQRQLPDMPAFCHPLTKEQIRAELTRLKGRAPAEIASALGNLWLEANGEKAACVTWYGRQQRRYATGAAK